MSRHLLTTPKAMLVGLLLFLAAVIGASAMLSACTPTLPAGINIRLADDKAMYLAEAAFAGALVGVETALETKSLNAEQAGDVAGLLSRAYEALTIARLAHTAADTESKTVQILLVIDIVGQIGAIIESSKQ